ncbi:MAG: hypothetical protein JNM07_04020 [Phycisphaerae bacterium]|nr:hypothetical protein [Phycisphaerae bacterium]
MVAQVLLLAMGAYTGLGLIVALLFVTFGVARVDPGASGAPLLFRALIAPGCVALWPLVLFWWCSAGGAAGARVGGRGSA